MGDAFSVPFILSWFEIKMLIARGLSDINSTLSARHHVIILLPFSLPLSIHSSSVSVCLPAFFTIIFSSSSRPGSLYLPTSLAKILSSSSTSNALSLAIVFPCFIRVGSCSLPFTFSLLSA